MDSFIFSKNGIWGDFLVVESNRLKETIEFIKQNKINLIELNYYKGYTNKNISFLMDIAHLIEGLLIVDEDIDLKGIEMLTNLRMLSITDEKRYPIDFAIFKNLERCSLLWHKNYQNLNQCENLKGLLLKKFKFERNNILLFTGMTRLQSLTFIQSTLENLDFIKNTPILSILEIYYASTLKDISGLINCHESLKRLIIDHCKNISDYNILGKLTKLEFLGIHDSKDLESLNFVKSLPDLDHISFVGTNVIDGNLAPCIGIKHVGFNNKKHYTHTYEDFKKTLD